MLLLADNAAFDIVFYVAMIGVAALLLGLVWLWLRKRFQDDAGDPSLGAGFTLQELTRLHEQGDLTDEQYERARSRVTQAGSTFTEQRVDASRTRPATPGEQTGSTPKPDP
ncbi:MAG: SHOCT domain-containing protein, partial [Phycisphaeraceae bacterium]